MDFGREYLEKRPRPAEGRREGEIEVRERGREGRRWRRREVEGV